MSRNVFDRELQNLKDRLLTLGSEVEQNVAVAVDVLIERDDLKARRLIAADTHINEEQMSIENDSLILLATQQPLATDLRILASVISIATELERINDYAKGIAKIQLMTGDDELLEVSAVLPRMAQKARDMLHRSLQAFIERDVDAAYAIHEEDDEVDALYNRVYEQLVADITADANIMDQATHLLWAAHNLERTADRVSNICERVVFTVTGRIVEMPEESEIAYPQQ
ncbi:MAG TPA: phosphate signaling complex protein PhoU [Candidatus Binatia bacterium]|jgi:phosphate transport system protein|nr:phosphate signaling complex protein PhoU [Candidatus Binatia bacterium]